MLSGNPGHHREPVSESRAPISVVEGASEHDRGGRQPVRKPEPGTEAGPRTRYLGYEDVLVEWKGITILVDFLIFVWLVR